MSWFLELLLDGIPQFLPPPPPYIHLATSENLMWCWSGERGILRKLSLCYNMTLIVYSCNGVIVHVMVYKAKSNYYRLVYSILLGLVLYHPSTCVSLIFVMLYRVNFFGYIFFLSWAWWDWPLTWLTNHFPSVLWHCWLGHTTCKIVSILPFFAG